MILGGREVDYCKNDPKHARVCPVSPLHIAAFVFRGGSSPQNESGAAKVVSKI